jgi:very-short-patch-repair endonuclease
LLPSPTGRGVGGEGMAKRETSSADTPSSGAARHLLPVGEGKEQPLSLVFAIPDHPWVDSVDGAAVRIAMTVAARNHASGRLLQVTAERDNGDEVDVDLSQRTGLIHADLRTGANVASAKPLQSNLGISQRGLELGGAGFIVTEEDAQRLGEDMAPHSENIVRPYRNGRDLTDRPRKVFLIDLYGLDEDTVRRDHPRIYQHLVDRVKPEREQNRSALLREKWWLHRRLREDLRAAIVGVQRYIATVETAKHRTFQFLGAEVAPDNMLVVVAIEDGLVLGVLSSSIHVVWSLAAGGRLGVGNDPRYNKSRCFDPFPFPTRMSLLPSGEGARRADEGTTVATPSPPTPLPAGEGSSARIRTLAENLDTHRKRQQAAHPELTLTGMYNVLDKLRSGEVLSAKERVIHEQGLVSVLRQIHDELDAAVLDAYGWSDLLPLLRVAHGNGTSALLPSPTGRGAGGESRRRLPKAPLPQETIAFARTLRREQTDAETLMWMLLRDRRLHGMKFRRQHPVPPYTLDFYCHPLKLAVELDGSQHLDSARDQARDVALNDAGIEVLRYWNHDVLARTEQVLDDLWNRIDHRSDVIAGETAAAEPSPPAPLPVGEGSAMTRDEAKRAFDDAVLERLVALNAERAAEEARGVVRWLRPEFQNPQATPTQQAIDTGPEEDPADDIVPTASIKPQPWPKDAVAQVRAVADALSTSAVPLSLDEIAARFTARGPWKKRLPQLIDMLVAMGRAREDAGRFHAMG